MIRQIAFAFVVSGLAVGSIAKAETPAASAHEALYGTLKKIHDSGTIVIGNREAYIPFSYLDASKKPVGYSLDICHKIVGAIKTELKMSSLQVQYVLVTPANRIQMVKDGKVDLECSATTHTLARRKDVDFSETIMLSTMRLIAKKEAGLHEIKQLAGKRVAVAANTSNLSDLRAALKDAKVEAKIIETKDHDLAFAAVDKGEADAAILEELVAAGMIPKAKDPAAWELKGPAIAFEPNGFLVRQNDSAFRLVVDRSIARTFSSGEIYQIYDKWFKPLNQPMSDAVKTMIQIGSIPE